MDKSNKIENLANKYVERHIRDRHLSDDTIKEIKIAYIMIIKDFIAIVDKSTSMNEDDIIYVVNNISSILYEPVEISNTDKKILEIGDVDKRVYGGQIRVCQGTTAVQGDGAVQRMREAYYLPRRP